MGDFRGRSLRLVLCSSCKRRSLRPRFAGHHDKQRLTLRSPREPLRSSYSTALYGSLVHSSRSLRSFGGVHEASTAMSQPPLWQPALCCSCSRSRSSDLFGLAHSSNQLTRRLPAIPPSRGVLPDGPSSCRSTIHPPSWLPVSRRVLDLPGSAMVASLTSRRMTASWMDTSGLGFRGSSACCGSVYCFGLGDQ